MPPLVCYVPPATYFFLVIQWSRNGGGGGVPPQICKSTPPPNVGAIIYQRCFYCENGFLIHISAISETKHKFSASEISIMP